MVCRASFGTYFRECVKELGRRVRREVGDVNILVNNAGIMITKQFMQFTDNEIENTVNVSEKTLILKNP